MDFRLYFPFSPENMTMLSSVPSFATRKEEPLVVFNTSSSKVIFSLVSSLLFFPDIYIGSDEGISSMSAAMACRIQSRNLYHKDHPWHRCTVYLCWVLHLLFFSLLLVLASSLLHQPCFIKNSSTVLLNLGPLVSTLSLD